MTDWLPSKPEPQPHGANFGEVGKLENKQDKSVIRQKEKLWLELQKRWERIDVKELYRRRPAVTAAEGG